MTGTRTAEERGVTLYTDKHHIPFLVDADDVFAVRRYSWHIGSDGYPTTTAGKRPNRRCVPLHAFLMGCAPDGLEWDHRNRIKTDNRRPNLRTVTHRTNMRNKGLERTNKSGQRGVNWNKAERRWWATISVSRVKHYLGSFVRLEDAVAARVVAERQYWSEV